MNKQQLIEVVQDMRMRISSLENTIMKMEMSGKFDVDDPRFKTLQDHLWQMEKQMSDLCLMIGDRPYKMEHPSLDRKPKEDNNER